MSDLLFYCLLGLGAGALYSGLALGVVLNFRGACVVNLGLGGAATIAAYLFYGLVSGGYLFLPAVFGLPDKIPLGGPWPILPAVLLSVAIVAAFGAAFDRWVMQKLRHAPALSRLIATLGLLMIAQAIVSGRFGTSGLMAPAVLSEQTVHVAGLDVPLNRLVLGGLVLVVTVALWLLYRYTRFGLRTRAASENEEGAALMGLSTNRLSMINTTMAFALAALMGILVAPISQLDPTVLSNAIVPALAAALLARFTSFPIAAAAGVGMGVVQSLVTYLQSFSWFPASSGLPLQGVADLLFFLAVVVAMVLRGDSLPVRGASLLQRLPKAPAPERILRPAVLACLVGAVALLVLPFGARQAIIYTSIALIVCLSLVVLVGYAGQLSLVQTGLAGVAGFTMSKLASGLGLGFPWSPLLAIGATVLVGVLIAIPALRVRGVHLAIVTMAAAVALNTFGFSNEPWGASSQGSPVPEPKLLGLSLGPRATWFFNYSQLPTPVFGILCLLLAVGLAMAVASLRRSHLGQAMLAMRSNERAAAAAGIDVRRIKITAFALSSALSGVAGVLYAYNYGSVSASRYTLLLGLTFISFVLMFGVGAVQGAVAAALGAVQGVIIFTVGLAIDLSANFQLLLGGVGLILTVIIHPDGVAVRDKNKRRQKTGRTPLTRRPGLARSGARSAAPGRVAEAEAVQPSAVSAKKEVRS